MSTKLTVQTRRPSQIPHCIPAPEGVTEEDPPRSSERGPVEAFCLFLDKIHAFGPSARAGQLCDRLYAWVKSIPAAIPGPNPDHQPARALEETGMKPAAAL